uniref:Cl17080_1 n=1 Tax=Arundo donax TaxID=35708 RepID=A0A0A8XTV7_ARUDO
MSGRELLPGGTAVVISLYARACAIVAGSFKLSMMALPKSLGLRASTTLRTPSIAEVEVPIVRARDGQAATARRPWLSDELKSARHARRPWPPDELKLARREAGTGRRKMELGAASGQVGWPSDTAVPVPWPPKGRARTAPSAKRRHQQSAPAQRTCGSQMAAADTSMAPSGHSSTSSGSTTACTPRWQPASRARIGQPRSGGIKALLATLAFRACRGGPWARKRGPARLPQLQSRQILRPPC